MANISEKLAGMVPDRGVKIAYGEKVTIGGTELIPVAFVSYGFGSGSGSMIGEVVNGKESEGSGDGAGGGGVAIPVGAYVSTEEGIRFHANPITALWVLIPVIGVLGWAISRIVKAA